MPKRFAWVLLLTALLVRAPAFFSHQVLMPAVNPLGPLPVWLQPYLNTVTGGWGGLVLGWVGALADAASAIYLANLVERRRLADRLLTANKEQGGWGSPGFWAGLAWAAHPVAGFLAGSVGVWQSLTLLALLSATWNLEYSAHPSAENRAAWSIGIAISLALWPLLLLPLGAAALLSKRARLRFYATALVLPLALALPWLVLKSPNTVGMALVGPPSAFGLSGVLTSLWSAVGAPRDLLVPLLQAWQGIAVSGLLLYFFASLWRPIALLPGLALGAWVWILLAPQLQAPLLLAPLGLILLVPGRLPWRLTAATFVLLVLQDRLPGLRDLQLQPNDPSGLWRGTHLVWAAFLLAWIFWVLIELIRLGAYARRSQRSSSFY